MAWWTVKSDNFHLFFMPWLDSKMDSYGSKRSEERLHKYTSKHAGEREFVANPQAPKPKSRWKPIDQPKEGTKEDVADSSFWGTFTEKNSWRGK